MLTWLGPLHRVNDWLLRINDVDLINKDKKQAIRALLNGEGAINMVVRRRKSLGGKVVTPLHINLSGHKGSSSLGDGRSLFSWRGIVVVFGSTSFPGRRPGCRVMHNACFPGRRSSGSRVSEPSDLV